MYFSLATDLRPCFEEVRRNLVILGRREVWREGKRLEVQFLIYGKYGSALEISRDFYKQKRLKFKEWQ